MQYNVNNSNLEYDAQGQKGKGGDTVLLHHAVDLTANTTWSDAGFTIEKLFDDVLYQTFITNTKELLVALWRKAGLNITDDFNIDQYHTLANTSEIHLNAVELTKLLSTEQFPVPVTILEDRISSICGKRLITQNPFDNQSIFHFRVVRPQQPDNNPLHRDVWLEDYKDCINLYIPIAGSNENSSLIIVPQSHQWSESKTERTLSGAVINNVKFNVPAVTSIEGEVNYVRPNPAMNEVLVFSPYLIHGGSVNANINTTRISIEVRLWKR
ncbi:MAG TPA: hypothetical protein VIM65_13455 [Cyclobacteriaceae bacterium]